MRFDFWIVILSALFFGAMIVASYYGGGSC